MRTHRIRLLLTVIASSVALVDAAVAGTRYAAVTGLDDDLCGTKAKPCRSIRRAIDHAADGDTVVVGPGRYGDLNNNGITGEDGEEVGFAFCGCTLGIDRSVTVVSSAGAAATVIDSRLTAATTTVFLIGTNATFGKPGKGFTVTATSMQDGDGITVLGENLRVAGNQVLADAYRGAIYGYGITTKDTSPGPVVIEANQVVGWSIGILADAPGTTVRKNVVTLNGIGIFARGGGVATANIATSNSEGIRVVDGGTAIGNTSTANRAYGVSAYTGATVAQNNLFGNAFCGLFTDGTGSIVATNNFWGAPTGPGPDPADLATTPGYPCNKYQVSVTFTPFATMPFAVKAPIKP
jgi:hypothetical protein